MTVGWALFFAGCVSIPLTPPRVGISPAQQYVPIPQNISGPVDANRARIFFITNMDSRILATVWKGHIRISDGQTVIGQLQSAGYLCWERGPGDTLIKFTMPGNENDNGWYVQHFSSYQIRAEAGHSYYLYFAGLAQRSILLERDAIPFLSAYPAPIAADIPPAPVNTVPAAGSAPFSSARYPVKS